MRYIIHYLMLLFSLFLPASAFSWGSLYPGETHQYIIETAYNRLTADPAYAASLFPTFSMIKGHEGVQWTANGLFGVGPDGAGMSTYSEHYYNPVTREGNGPTSAARHFSALVRSNLSGKPNTEAGGKSAAYSAHFLADMFVPYHVVGTSRKNAEKIWVEQNTAHPGTINLGISITGSQQLTYLTPFKGGNNNFNTELTRFITLTDPPESDWFDPWYYNGNTDTMMINTSSHVAWEAIANGTPVINIHKRAGQGVQGYDPQWKNASTPRFNQNLLDAQSEQVRRLAIFSATETRSRLEAYFNDPTQALMNAIQSVYSIWRASFSGLRPTITYQPDGKNSYKITGNIKNLASAPASSVRVRLTAKDCSVSGSQEQTLDLIGTGLSMQTTPWGVTTTDKLCKLKLEVVASYPVPDLQYAVTESTFFPQKQEPEPLKPAKKPDTATRQTVVDKEAKGAWVLVDISKKAWDLNINEDVFLKCIPGCKQQDGSDVTYTGSSTDNSFSISGATFGTGKSGSYRRSWDIQGSWDKPPASLLPGEIFNFGCAVKQVNAGGGTNPGGVSITISNGVKCSSNGTPPSNTATWKMKVPIPDSDWDCRNYGRRCQEEPVFKLTVNARVINNNFSCCTNKEHGYVPFLAYRTYTYKWKPGAAGNIGSSSSEKKPANRPDLTAMLAEAEQLMLQRDNQKLLTLSEKIVALDPTVSEGYRFRGNARRGLNDTENARSDYNQALKLDPSNVRAMNGLSQIKRKSGDLQGALTIINRAMQINPDYHAGLDTRATIYHELKQYQLCIDDSTRALALAPGTTLYLSRRGAALENIHDFKGALRDYDAVLAKSPGDPFATKGRARVLTRL